MASRRYSKLWNYFEELNPSLVKCMTCKEEIKISHPSKCTTIFRAHLLIRHGLFLGNDTRTLPDELRQYYSELPEYKAKCKDCGKTLSFLSKMKDLREHLRRHSIRIQSQDETLIMAPTRNLGYKRSKLWNYFEELNPFLVKCTKCKEEIKISRPENGLRILRTHLNRHGISPDKEIPNDLRQYYSELPGYKAKCNDCGKTVSFVSDIVFLRKHLRRHSVLSTRIQSRELTVITAGRKGKKGRKEGTEALKGKLGRKRNKLWNYIEELKPLLIKCTKCKEEIQIPSRAGLIQIFKVHLFKAHGMFLSFTLPDKLRKIYSELPGYKAKCNDCGATISFLSTTTTLQRHLIKKHFSRIQNRDKPSTSSSADYIMDTSAERQSGEPPGLPIQSFKEETDALYSD